MLTLEDLDIKFVEAYMRDKFSRPFKRRMKYLYFGLEVPENLFVLSTTEDVEFKFCEPLQATGLLQIDNPEHLQKIKQWLTFCKLDVTKPFIWYYEVMINLLNKKNWKNPNIVYVATADQVTMQIDGGDVVLIARRVETYFTITKLQAVINEYRDVLLDNKGQHYDITYEDKKSASIVSQTVPENTLFEKGLMSVPQRSLTLVLLAGLDLLIKKSLILEKVENESAIRMWTTPGTNSFRFGSYFRDTDISIAVARDNIFVFPKQRSEILK